MSYHTGNNNNNNRSSQQRSTPASTPPVTPTQLDPPNFEPRYTTSLPLPGIALNDEADIWEDPDGTIWIYDYDNKYWYDRSNPTASTPPVPTPPASTPAQRSGNTNQSDRNPLREVTSTGSDRGGFEARECPDEAPDGNGKPLTDDGSVWENPPPCSTIFVWDYEGGVWVRQEGEGKPDDAIEGGGTGEGSGLTDEQAREWQFYRDFLDWYFNQILLILSETHPYQEQGHWDGLTAKEAMQRFAEYLELLWGLQDPNRCRPRDPNYSECDPKYWPIPTMPRGWDRDQLEKWERENGYTIPASTSSETSSIPTQRSAVGGVGGRNTYENGKRIPGNFPAAYQNSLNKAGPAGQKCGNCKLFNQNSAYCSAWKATANKNYWCQSYVPYVNITRSGTAVSSSGGVFSLRDSNNKLITYKKGTTVVYDGELYEVTKNVFGQIPDKSSSFVKITNIDDNVIDGGSFGETSSVTRTPVRRSSSGSSSSSSGGGY